MELEKLKGILPDVMINTMAAREHKGEIERKRWVIKESARGMVNTLPYRVLPKLMTIKLMHFCVMWMNSFPVKSGVSDKWSSRELASWHQLDAKLHCKNPFWGKLQSTHGPGCKWTLWCQGLDKRQYVSDPLGTCRRATNLCCSLLGRRSQDVNSQRCQ
jgi:hypothetical protein